MKYRILVAVLSLVLAAVILLLLPSAHPEQIATEPSLQLPSVSTLAPTTLPPEPGVVRLYSCSEQILAAFDTLAAQYTALTGTEVVVLRPEGENCQTALARYMESETPPTVLCVHSAADLSAWSGSLLDLEGTALADALVSADFGVYLDGKLLGLPVDLEGFGLLVNADLLGTKGALSRNDIQDLASLTTAAQILKSNSVKAFSGTVMDIENLLQLACTADMAALRTFLDLYVANGLSAENLTAQFQNGKAAFHLDGTWNYETLTANADTALLARHVDILPTFTSGALQYVFRDAWCVNGSVRSEDLAVTLDFMTWLVTAGEDTAAPVDSLQMLTPFADAAWYGNQLEKKLLGYMRSESAALQWQVESRGQAKLVLALQAYINSPSDEAWSQVETYLPQTTQ